MLEKYFVVGDPKVCKGCYERFIHAKCKLLGTPNNGKNSQPRSGGILVAMISSCRKAP